MTPLRTKITRWGLVAMMISAMWLPACRNGGATASRDDAARSRDEPPPSSPQQTARASSAPSQEQTTGGWVSLFDGRTLGGWKPTSFGGEGEVRIEEGRIILPFGNDLTGVHWGSEPPARMNYEIELEAMRIGGSDFFCGLTFPVGRDYCSLICGGWGGGLTGLSSLDGYDASENDTSQWINYENGKWYRIRLRVTEDQIEAWLDDRQIVDVMTTGRQIGIRLEVEPSKPLGIATWRTTGALRNIRWREVDGPAD